jgi:hypothetical protein
MIGAETGEVMAAVQTPMLADLPYVRLRDAILAHPTMVAHPTMAEGLGRAAAARRDIVDRPNGRARRSVADAVFAAYPIN